MYLNLLFILLNLLLVSQGPSFLPFEPWVFSSAHAFIYAMGLYAGVLLLIVLQTFFFGKRFGSWEGLLILANLELLGFSICYEFLFGAWRVFSEWKWFPNSDTLIFLFPLILYFFGLWCFHLTLLLTKKRPSAWKEAVNEVRLLFPFILPFLLITFVFDLLIRIPGVTDFWILYPLLTETLEIGFALTFFLALMVFIPALMQWFWNCKPFPEGPLKEKLDALCQRAQFRHAGLKIWTVLNHAITAGIIGIIPRYRYIIFTKRLIKQMPSESIEAVLAHELGHGFYKHLWIYPFILSGISVLSLFLYAYVVPLVVLWLKPYTGGFFLAAILFVTYALPIALYFRFVFGFFSRQFERQADLYVFRLGIPAHNLINALQFIAVSQGNNQKKYSWHHFGIQQRIDLLYAADRNPELIEKHNRFVKYSLAGYLALLMAAIVFIF